MQQNALTIRAELLPGKLADLEEVLRRVQEDLPSNPLVPFGKLDTVHFARFVILEKVEDLKGRTIPASLCFTSNFDGSEARHLDALVGHAAAGLDATFGLCLGYPEGRLRTRLTRLEFLRSHRLQAQAFYVNTRGRTVAQIRREDHLRREIERFLDAADVRGKPPRELRRAIRDFVQSQPSLRWAQDPSTPVRTRDRTVHLLALARAGLLGLLLLPVILPALVPALWYLRRLERRDAEKQSRLPSNLGRDPSIEAREDFYVHNPFSAVGFVKPGRFRLAVLRIVLWGIDFTARHLYNEGSLTGVETIHFARWILIDGNRRVLFCSNYDGSMESYMDDFINKVAWGLNAAFSNGMHYPETDWLVLRGAKDEQAFKAYINRNQILTQVWYSAYPHLSTTNILQNEKIRRGLLQNPEGRELEKWLHLF